MSLVVPFAVGLFCLFHAYMHRTLVFVQFMKKGMVQLSCTKNKSQEKLLGCKVSRRLGASLDFRHDLFFSS